MSRRIEVVPEEAAAVRTVFEMRLAGASDQAIADYLNGTGLRPRSRRGYTGWTAMSARELWRNGFYAGFVKHKGELRRGRHDALVSEEVWREAQPRGGSKRAKREGRTLLQGMAFCALCEGKLWLQESGGQVRKGRVVREPRTAYLDVPKLRGRECESLRRTWYVDEPDGQVSATMRSLGLDKGWLRESAREARKAGPVVSGSPERRRQLQAQRERATEAYVSGALSKARWQEVVSRVDEELSRLPENVARVLLAVRQLETFAEVWERMTMEFKREAVGTVFQRVLLDLGNREVLLEPREGYAGLLAGRAAVGRDLGPLGFEPDSRPTRLMRFTPADLGVRSA